MWLRREHPRRSNYAGSYETIHHHRHTEIRKMFDNNTLTNLNPIYDFQTKAKKGFPDRV